MPLPHFLLLVLAVIIAAAMTLWVTFSAGVPPIVILLIAMTAVALVHFSIRNRQDHDH